jgi:uncharacterized protein YkwD
MKTFKIFLMVTLALFSLVTTLSLNASPTNKQSYLSEQQAVLGGINAYRHKHGLKPLAIDPYISEAARIHSVEMANNKIPFGHEGFNQRMNQMFKHFDHSNAFAENVAFTSENIMTVIPLWIESKGHRENIEGNYDLTGIGIAYDNEGRVYVTQIFLNDDEKDIS